jgi:predicted transcriptional regulator
MPMEFGHGPFWKDFLFMLVIGVTITIIRSIYLKVRKKNENEKEHKYVGNIRNGSDTEQYIERLISSHEYRKTSKGQEDLTEKQKELYDTIKYIYNDHPSELISNKQITEKYQRRHGPLNLLPTDFCYNLINVGPDFEAKFLMSVD